MFAAGGHVGDLLVLQQEELADRVHDVAPHELRDLGDGASLEAMVLAGA